MSVRVGISVVPAIADLDRVRALVRSADGFGLDMVGLQDHPYQGRFLDTWSLIPSLLAQTGPDRHRATGRLEGNFPGGTVELNWDFTIARGLITRLEIAP